MAYSAPREYCRLVSLTSLNEYKAFDSFAARLFILTGKMDRGCRRTPPTPKRKGGVTFISKSFRAGIGGV
jgi:hypothetical protein